MSERIGPYEVVTKIGEGGMGDVYRAVDTRLDRTVAIKRVKGEFSERFEREARAISALNHPHIATLHDVGPGYIVMEYIDGKPLAGPLPLDKALEYARQILSALEAAHKLGIVHRDLKPANILVTKAGVKLLDFGLAKMRPAASAAAAEHTVTPALTGENTIVGTPQYMSPEQIEGREADARSDLFAFGCVLYEMLTGTRAFDGKSAPSVMAAVLAAEPRPLRELVPVVPERLDKVLRACLAKDPDERWQNVADLRRELEWLPAQQETVKQRRFAWLPWAVAGAAVLSCLAAFLWLRKPAEADADRVAFTMTGPWRILFGGQGGMAVSPDGRKVALIAVTKEGQRGIWIRDLAQAEPKLLVSHPGVQGVFWSPDSGSVGFTVGDQLRIADLSTGEARTVAKNIGAFRGASWSAAGDIVYSASNGAQLWAVKPGEPPRLALAQKAGERRMLRLWPSFLPDGKHFLYVGSGSNRETALYAAAIGDSEPKRLMDTPSSAIYSNGHLLWANSGLMARSFDPGRLEFTGKTIQLAPDVGIIGRFGLFAVSDNTLAYYSSYFERTMIAWTDATGADRAPVSKPGTAHAEVSPDGKRILYSRDLDLWLWDLATGAESRLTFSPRNDWVPAWSSDGEWAYWATQGDGKTWEVLRKRSNGAGAEELLLSHPQYLHHLHLTPDAKTIAIECGAAPATDLCLFSMKDRKLTKLLTSSFTEMHPQFSPDGKWLAMVSDSSGRYEVYVYGFPSMSGPWQVSREGGVQPRWRGDGKVLYYLDHRGQILGVDVSSAGAAFVSGAEHRKVLTTEIEPMTATSHYAAAPDGKHFVVTQRPNADELQIVRHWSGLLKR